MMVSTYQQALDYLYSNLPIFQRVGSSAYRPDLTNTIRLCETLNNPEHSFKSIHVAGTNGKGSTSHMLASILQSAGYKTGLYTSPHLKEFTERIRVNGQDVRQDFVIGFVNRIAGEIEKIKPSFFEITVVMAFEYFRQEAVDVAVIEVGLGGRLDSTNVIAPEVSLITNIGWDHKDILGDTLEMIAAEKAGIIKSGTPVVVSERQEAVSGVFVEKAASLQSPITFASDRYEVLAEHPTGIGRCDVLKDGQVYLEKVNLPLQGLYQRKNLPGVLMAVDIVNDKGFVIPVKQMIHGLENTLVQTGLKGRWQQLSKNPLVICDTGHNVDGVREILRQIDLQQYEQLHMVWGCVKDKDVSDILRLLPKEARYYFCQAKIPRAMDAQSLATLAAGFGLQGEVLPDVNDALARARQLAYPSDLIFVGGSTFVVAELNEL
jgi:dihydrofolate synthase / folylpolyglutamate synthase